MKTPLLLLHGALGCAAQFDPLRPLLLTEDKTYAPDFPGHGGTPFDQPFSIAYFSDFVLHFLDRLQLDRVRIFGYSMGGYVGLQLACAHPDRVDSISTLGTKFNWTPESAERETALLQPDKIEQKVPAFAQLLADRHAPADWKEVVRQTAGLMRLLGQGAALQEPDFRSLQCAVRIGLGELDNMVTPEESRTVAAQIPSARFEVLPQAKHPIEQVDLQLLATWLSNGQI
ncbi:MAG: alpha/beta fold hydrolase [Bacteroidetes bacterium]|nr:MAG: alpha/beta fold hydrolase [Bacteroidota bacterium]